MKKNANIPILLLLIVAVAVTAQLTRHSGEKPEWQLLRKDMVASLTRLWGQEGHKVELMPAGERVDARVSVSTPRGLRLRQQRWNYPFLRFVAARHPGVTLDSLNVVESGTDRLIPELATAGLFADRVAPRANFDDEEERLCQLTSRQLTSALEHKLGPGGALVLVDAQLARSSRDEAPYGAPPGELLARRAAGAVAQPMGNRVMVTNICVVVHHQVPAQDLDVSRFGYSRSGVDFRVVTLP